MIEMDGFFCRQEIIFYLSNGGISAVREVDIARDGDAIRWSCKLDFMFVSDLCSIVLLQKVWSKQEYWAAGEEVPVHSAAS